MDSSSLPLSLGAQRDYRLNRRARAEMRAGQPVVITNDDKSFLAVAAECLNMPLLERCQAYGAGKLYLTAPRARALGWQAADGLVALSVPLKADIIHALIDPTALRTATDIAAYNPAWHAADGVAGFAMQLAKLAGMLPAIWLVELDADHARCAHRDELFHIAFNDTAVPDAMPALALLGSARVPLAAAPNTRVHSFRSLQDGAEHLALLVNQPDLNNAPLVRLHSSCLTGDILGSLRCDCGPQLQAAIRTMNDHAGGIVLYLQQEGRGIGLLNKLRAYQLQDTGLDTYEANAALGFENDERDFHIAALMLKQLGVKQCRLLTNNPRKIAQLEQYGIQVVERLPLAAGENDFNAAYLRAKGDKGGHLLT